MARLPEDVVDLIDALAPGDDLVITRDGHPVATISSAGGLLDDVTEPGPPDHTYGDVTVVATAMKLSAAARTSLSEELGADYIVLDLHSAPRTADVLLVPPVSPQLIGSLGSMFPKARVVIAEVEDPELGVSYHGPIRRLLDAGATTYLAANAVPQLAQQLDTAITRHAQLTSGEPGRLTIESGH